MDGADKMAFYTFGSARMAIDFNGNVGIGTTSPGYLLDVSSFAVDGGTIRIASSSSCQFRMMEVNDTYGFSFTNVAASRMSIKRHSASQAGTEVISILRDSSAVGIGTTSPTALFHVSGNRSRFDAGSEPYAIAVSYSQATGGSYWIGASNSATPDLVFSQGGGAERMRITNSGLVGIGTTNPSGKLTVATSGGGTSAGGGWDANWSVVHGTTVGAAGGGVGIAFNDGNFGLLSCVAPSIGWRTMLYGAGRHDFYINGTFGLAMYNLMTGGATTISVDAGGGLQRGAVSDRRLKSNIVTMTDFGLKTITDLRPVTYEATPESLKRIGAGVHIGLVAQEVQTIFPYAVSADQDEQKTLTIDYIKLVPVMINAIKELSAENTQLKTQMSSLEQRLAALESKLAA